jgi:tRNA threonylcarbamoyladenosine biosynthesis protein TsaE
MTTWKRTANGRDAAPLVTAGSVRALHTRRDTRSLGDAIARVLAPGDLALVSGEMGAGKTFLVRSIARGLGTDARVTSPTFALVHEYPTRRGLLLHADLHRLHRLPGARADAKSLEVEVAALGLRERRGEGVLVVVEWGEEAVDALGGHPALIVSLAIAGTSERVATLSGPRSGDIV